MELRGVQYQVDARGRSSTGFGDTTYTGSADPEESTLFGKALDAIMFHIKAGNVKLKGLTITGGAKSANTIQIDSPTKKIEITNCVFRHIQAKNVIHSNGKIDLNLVGCQFQDLVEVSHILYVEQGGDIKVVFTTFQNKGSKCKDYIIHLVKFTGTALIQNSKLDCADFT